MLLITRKRGKRKREREEEDNIIRGRKTLLQRIVTKRIDEADTDEKSKKQKQKINSKNSLLETRKQENRKRSQLEFESKIQ